MGFGLLLLYRYNFLENELRDKWNERKIHFVIFIYRLHRIKGR